MRQWYGRSIRNQLQCVVLSLLACTVAAVLTFSFLTLHTLSVTNDLVADQEMMIQYDALFGDSRQCVTRFVYTGNQDEQHLFAGCAQQLQGIAQTLYAAYPSAYVYSLYQVTNLYVDLGSALLEEKSSGANLDALLQYNRLQTICGTIEYFLPYAQSAVADGVSQHVRALEEEQRRVILASIFAFAAAIGLTFFIISRIISKIILSLQFLTQFALRVEKEQWHIEVPQRFVQGKDELALLTRAMRQMAQTIHAQMQQIQLKAELEQRFRQKEREVLESQLQLSHMRLKMLQEQVKPHFLFNCLNMISKLAFIEGAPRCQKAADLIARYMREVLERGEDTSTLEQEFSCSRDYCRIQEMRFGEHFSFFVYCQEICRPLRLPSMCLQPLVENAFIHGLNKCARKGWIHCSAVQEQDCVLIRVEDNGAGLTPERIQWIYQQIESSQPTGSDCQHIGLIGTAKRLKYFFGPALSLHLESTPQVGTAVTLRIPQSD